MWQFSTSRLLGSFAVTLLACSTTYATAPKGWQMAGSAPQDYEVGTQSTVDGPPQAVAYLRSNTEKAHGFGTLMQSFSADRYAGHRVRLSAEVKSDRLSQWAGLWMRADKEAKPVAFDNMHDRAIRGSQSWQHYDVVLDIPPDATSLHFGILLVGSGEVDVSGLKFEILPNPRIPQLGPPPMQTHPVNLDFEH